MPVFSNEDPDHFIVRCDMTGTYITENGGHSYLQFNFANWSSAYGVDPANRNTLYIVASTLNRSTDGGNEWKQIFPNPDEVIAVSYTGDHASLKIETSDSSLYTLTNGRINTILIDPADSESIFFSMDRFFFYSTDGGNIWSRKELAHPVDYLYTSRSGTEQFVYIFTAESLYLFDKKLKEVSKKDLPKEISPAFSFAGGTVAESDSIIFYALHNDPNEKIQEGFGHTELWISRDKGQTWRMSQDPVTRIYLACWADITLSDLVGGNVLRENGVENKMLDMPGGIFRSEDGGNTWNSIFDEEQYVYNVMVDLYHPGRLYCNTVNKVAWLSDDYGKSWKKLKEYDFHWGHRAIVDQQNPDKVFLTTYGSSVWQWLSCNRIKKSK